MFYKAALAHPVQMMVQPSDRHKGTAMPPPPLATDDLSTSDCHFSVCLSAFALRHVKKLMTL